MSLGSRLSGGSQASAPPPVAQVDALAVGACVLAPYHGEYYEATIEALLTQQRAVVKFDGYGNSEDVAERASRRRYPPAGRSCTTKHPDSPFRDDYGRDRWERPKPPRPAGPPQALRRSRAARRPAAAGRLPRSPINGQPVGGRPTTRRG